VGDVQFNIAKGRVVQYFQNVEDDSPSGSEIHVVVLEASGLVSDDAMMDYDTLAAVLAGASTEQTTMGRKYLVASDITITVDDTSNYAQIGVGDITWSGATGNATGKLLFCYDPDGHLANTDSTVIPLLAYDFTATPDGSDIVVSDDATTALIRVT
jgi:hypothetical protein